MQTESSGTDSGVGQQISQALKRAFSFLRDHPHSEASIKRTEGAVRLTLTESFRPPLDGDENGIRKKEAISE